MTESRREMHMRYECLKGVCESRRSCRRFQPEPVPPELIEGILAAAYAAPHGQTKKDWGICVINDQAVIADFAQRVEEACRELKESLKEDYKFGFSQYAEYFTIFQTAPVLLVTYFKVKPSLSSMTNDESFSLPRWERDNYVKSIAGVSMIILLAAESLGLGSCYMTGPLIAQQKILGLLNLSKDHEIGAVIPVGYPLYD